MVKEMILFIHWSTLSQNIPLNSGNRLNKVSTPFEGI